MKYLFQPWGQLLVVGVMFFGTVIHGSVGALIFFIYFFMWVWQMGKPRFVGWMVNGKVYESLSQIETSLRKYAKEIYYDR